MRYGGRGRNDDPLASLIKRAILYHNMINVFPQSVGPTWDNGRLGASYLAKSLDNFLMNDKLMNRMGMPLSTIVNCFIFSYHYNGEKGITRRVFLLNLIEFGWRTLNSMTLLKNFGPHASLWNIFPLLNTFWIICML